MTMKNEPIKMALWLTGEHRSPEQLHAATAQELLESWYCTIREFDADPIDGWSAIGLIEVSSVTLLSKASMIDKKMESLQAQLQKERADTEVKQNAILLQISKLQAIEFDGKQQ